MGRTQFSELGELNSAQVKQHRLDPDCGGEVGGEVEEGAGGGAGGPDSPAVIPVTQVN